MSEVFRVAIHYDKENGYIEYDQSTKLAKVFLDHSVKKPEVESFLSTTRTIRAAQTGLCDFKEWQAVPIEDLATFKLALGKLWEQTGVHVDWSRPVA